jgi:hypothetical protein
MGSPVQTVSRAKTAIKSKLIMIICRDLEVISMGRVLALIGVFSSVLYMALIWWLVGDRISTLKSISLNEVGDFLAGAFGPLAILWLVLGFFQQGIELRQGTKALNLQTDELRGTMEQQVEMVKAYNKNLENYERSLDPILSLERGHSQEIEGEPHEVFDIFNYGPYCDSIKVHISDGNKIVDYDLEPLITGASRGFFLSDDFCDIVHVSVRYLRSNKSEGLQSFTLKRQYDEADEFYIIKKTPSRMSL